VWTYDSLFEKVGGGDIGDESGVLGKVIPEAKGDGGRGEERSGGILHMRTEKLEGKEILHFVSQQLTQSLSHHFTRHQRPNSLL